MCQREQKQLFILFIIGFYGFKKKIINKKLFKTYCKNNYKLKLIESPNMQSENICRLCLLSKNNIIHFSSEEGLNLQITNILAQHFWFKIQQNDGLPHAVCRMCWSNTKEFHEFYISTEIAHERFKGIEINEYSENYAIKSIDNKVDQNYNSIVETTHQLNEFNVMDDLIDVVKLEVENLTDDKYYDENNDRWEIFNQPKFDLIEKEIKKSKSINDKNKSVRNIIKEKIDTKIRKPFEISLFKIGKINGDENYLNYNNGGDQNEENKLDQKPKIIAEQDRKTAASKKRDTEDIQINEFFNLNCHLCSVGHSTFIEVNTHFRNVHNLTKGYVICCKRKLYKRSELLEHMQWHLNPDEFKCSICNKLLNNRHYLKLHMNVHITPDDRNFSCDICGKRFAVKGQIKQHLFTHIAYQNRMYKCNECDKCFASNSTLYSHVRGVHKFKNENAHICHVCAKIFKSKFRCDLHLSDHFNMEKVQCQICGSLLKNKTMLRRHVNRSHQAKPIECKYCGRISANNHALQTHIKYVHESTRSHKCNLCDKAFKNAINLREHVARHTGFELYTCPYCPKTFNSNGNMHSHKKKAHFIEWQKERHKKNGIN